MKKTLLILTLIFCLLLSCSAAALGADSGEMLDIAALKADGAGPGWAWDYSEKTLTLRDLHLDISSLSYGDSFCALRMPADSTILLEGSNSIIGHRYGVLVTQTEANAGDLRISGPGRLHIDAGWGGINSSGQIVIDSGAELDITVHSHWAVESRKSAGNDPYPLRSFNGVIAGSLSVEQASLSIDHQFQEGFVYQLNRYGYLFGGCQIYGDISLIDADIDIYAWFPEFDLLVDGEEFGPDFSVSFYGLFSSRDSGGDISIKQSRVDIASFCLGLGALNGDIEIIDSRVEAWTGSEPGAYFFHEDKPDLVCGVGIFAGYSDQGGSIYCRNSYVRSQGYMAAMLASPALLAGTASPDIRMDDQIVFSGGAPAGRSFPSGFAISTFATAPAGLDWVDDGDNFYHLSNASQTVLLAPASDILHDLLTPLLILNTFIART